MEKLDIEIEIIVNRPCPKTGKPNIDFSAPLPEWAQAETWLKIRDHKQIQALKGVFFSGGIPPMNSGRTVSLMPLYTVIETMNKTISWADVFAIDHVDHRAWVIEQLGWASFLKNHKHELLDSDEDPIIGKLYKTDVIDEEEAVHILECLDPAAEAPVYLRVNPKFTTAREARADLDPLSEFGDDYQIEA